MSNTFVPQINIYDKHPQESHGLPTDTMACLQMRHDNGRKIQLQIPPNYLRWERERERSYYHKGLVPLTVSIRQKKILKEPRICLIINLITNEWNLNGGDDVEWVMDDYLGLLDCQKWVPQVLI